MIKVSVECCPSMSVLWLGKTSWVSPLRMAESSTLKSSSTPIKMRWMSTDVVRRAQGAFPECEQRPALKRTGREKKIKGEEEEENPPHKANQPGLAIYPLVLICVFARARLASADWLIISWTPWVGGPRLSPWWQPWRSPRGRWRAPGAASVRCALRRSRRTGVPRPRGPSSPRWFRKAWPDPVEQSSDERYPNSTTISQLVVVSGVWAWTHWKRSAVAQSGRDLFINFQASDWRDYPMKVHNTLCCSYSLSFCPVLYVVWLFQVYISCSF